MRGTAAAFSTLTIAGGSTVRYTPASSRQPASTVRCTAFGCHRRQKKCASRQHPSGEAEDVSPDAASMLGTGCPRPAPLAGPPRCAIPYFSPASRQQLVGFAGAFIRVCLDRAAHRYEPLTPEDRGRRPRRFRETRHSCGSARLPLPGRRRRALAPQHHWHYRWTAPGPSLGGVAGCRRMGHLQGPARATGACASITLRRAAGD